MNWGDSRLPNRFWKKVYPCPVSGCWLFVPVNSDVYGQLWASNKTVKAHRFAYEGLVGSIPPLLQLDHLCRVRACVNPKHLEPVTQRENILRGEGKAAFHFNATHCKHGHEFTPENTYLWKGYRSCKTCNKHRGREWARKKRRRSNGPN